MIYAKTYHCKIPGKYVTHLASQWDIERLRADDPCWSGKVWETWETWKPDETIWLVSEKEVSGH